jgi:hypothetical protein
MGTEMHSLFRLSGPSQQDIDCFHNDGYIVFLDVLTDKAREKLIEEITQHEPVRQYIDALDDEPPNDPQAYFERPWNERGPYGDRLIDDPFITALLQATIGNDYHFCHSAPLSEAFSNTTTNHRRSIKCQRCSQTCRE